jgi:hypothetical protein
MRTLLSAAFAVIALIFAAVVVGGCNPTPPQGTTAGPPPAPPPIRPIPEHGVGEAATVGDIHVTVTGWVAHDRGEGELPPMNAMGIYFNVQNTSAGKVYVWQGWEGRVEAHDEHGNTFRARRMRSDHIFFQQPDAWEQRINPGQVYSTAIYLDPAPPSTKQLIVDAPVAGQIHRWRLTRK